MRHRTAALLFGAAAATGAAAIGATTAALLGQLAADRMERGYVAMTRALVTRPAYEDQGAAPEPGRHLHSVH